MDATLAKTKIKKRIKHISNSNDFYETQCPYPNKQIEHITKSKQTKNMIFFKQKRGKTSYPGSLSSWSQRTNRSKQQQLTKKNYPKAHNYPK